MLIYQKIKELRKERGLTQKKVAEGTGYTQAAVTEWERGISRPTWEAVKALALFFDVTSDYLLGLENEFGEKISK